MAPNREGCQLERLLITTCDFTQSSSEWQLVHISNSFTNRNAYIPTYHIQSTDAVNIMQGIKISGVSQIYNNWPLTLHKMPGNKGVYHDMTGCSFTSHSYMTLNVNPNQKELGMGDNMVASRIVKT